MAKKVFNMEGGLHSVAAYSAFENRIYGSCKATPDSFIAEAGAGMSVTISPGDGLISVDATLARRIQTDAPETVTVVPASTSYGRIDSLVAYIDTAVDPVTSVIDNTNDVLKFKVVAGTAAATPLAPSSASIQSSIGAGNPYMILTEITVPQNATNLSTATFNNIAPTPLLRNYPIGAIYISVSNINPQTLFGGKWQVFAAGRTLVGIDSSQTEFDTVQETGGAKTHTLTKEELPNYTLQNLYRYSTASGTQTNMLSSNSSQYTQPITSGGGDQPHNNLQPYIVTYMWKRVS